MHKQFYSRLQKLSNSHQSCSRPFETSIHLKTCPIDALVSFLISHKTSRLNALLIVTLFSHVSQWSISKKVCMGEANYNRITNTQWFGDKATTSCNKIRWHLKARKHQCERLAAAVSGLTICNVEVFKRQRCDAEEKSVFFVVVVVDLVQ